MVGTVELEEVSTLQACRYLVVARNATFCKLRAPPIGGGSVHRGSGGLLAQSLLFLVILLLDVCVSVRMCARVSN